METYPNSSTLPEEADDATGHCWYQSSGSWWSPVKGRKSTLGPFVVAILLTKKDIQLESCELSFIWDKIRTAAQEAASQIALRLLQSGSGGSQYIRF